MKDKQSTKYSSSMLVQVCSEESRAWESHTENHKDAHWDQDYMEEPKNSGKKRHLSTEPWAEKLNQFFFPIGSFFYSSYF